MFYQRCNKIYDIKLGLLVYIPDESMFLFVLFVSEIWNRCFSKLSKQMGLITTNKDGW